MGKIIARRQFLCCDRIGPAEMKTKSGLIVDDNNENSFVLYKVLNVGEETIENYKPGDVVFVEDSHTNVIKYGNKKYYLIDDAFIVAQLMEE